MPELPSRLHREVARVAEIRRAETMWRLSTPRGDQSAACPRLQGSRRSADHRSPALDPAIPLCGLQTAFRGGTRISERSKYSFRSEAAAGPRTRLLHAHDVRSGAWFAGCAEFGSWRRPLRRP